MLKLIAYSLVFLSIACSRATSEKASVVFHLPPSENQEKLTPSSTSYNKEPLNLDEINCYYVVAAGPETNMSQISCGRDKIDGSLDEVFKGGMLIGGVRTESTSSVKIEAEVPQGPDRVFYLLGVKRENNVDCFPLGERTHFNGLSKRSNVYILGQTSPTKLVAGVNQDIPITMRLDGQKWIDRCAKDKNTIGDSNPLHPESPRFLYLSSIGSAVHRSFSTGKCHPFQFEIQDTYGTPRFLQHDFKVKMEMGLDINGDGNVNDPFDSVKTFATLNDCINDDDGDNSPTFPTENTRMVRWIYIPHRPTSMLNSYRLSLRMTPSLSTLTPAHLSLNSQAYGNMQLREGSTSSLFIQGPKRVIKNICYKYFVDSKTLSLGPLSTTAYRFSNYGSVNNRTYSVYSDSSCSNEITEHPQVTANEVYLKFHHNPGLARANFVAQPSNFGSGILLNDMLVMSSPGSNTFDRLGIVGPTIIQTDHCQRLIVSLQNAQGASVTRNTNLNVNLSTTSSQVKFYTTSNCGTTPLTNTTLVIPAGSYGKEIYVRGSATEAVFSLEYDNAIEGGTLQFVNYL